MTVGIVGTRNCENFDVDTIIRHLPSDCTSIVSGGAGGIDTFAEAAAKQLGIPIKIYMPDYEKYGKTAPLKRNLEIAQNSDTVLAFWDMKSRGTANTIEHCLRQNVPVKVIDINIENH